MSERKITRNADNDYLMPWGGEDFVVGYVDEVNGRGAEEIAGFLPTRHELIALAKLWTRIWLDHVYDYWFLGGMNGSSTDRRILFAERRIARIEELLGGEEIDKVRDEVYDGFRKTVPPEDWNIFLNGSREQWTAVQDRVQRGFADPRPNRGGA